MAKQRVAVTYEMAGFIEIEADSMEEAMEKFTENSDMYPLPYEANYVDGSFQTVCNDVDAMKVLSNLK